MPFPHTPAFRLVPAVIALTVAGLLSGCGGGSPGERTVAADRSGDGAAGESGAEGTLDIGGRTFIFTPDMCMASGEDTLVSGPGKDADGAPVYVSLDATSSTQGELRVDLGTDKKFSSSDKSLQAGDSFSDISIEVAEDDVRVSGEFIDQAGTRIGTGVLAVSCR